jgi:hypothetical protein
VSDDITIDIENEITYADIIALVRWMFYWGYTEEDIVYTMEKPHKFLDEIARAKAERPPAEHEVS